MSEDTNIVEEIKSEKATLSGATPLFGGSTGGLLTKAESRRKIRDYLD